MMHLRGITWDHPRGYDPLVATARAYAEAHPGVTITWQTRSLHGFESLSVDRLAATYDLLVIDHPHVGAIAASRSVAALDDLLAPEALAALRRQSVGPSYESYRYDGHQWALAIDAAAQVAAYRPDLLAEPPRTWEDVLALARGGRVLWPLNAVHALMSFCSLAANQGTPCAASTGRFIDRTAGRAVLDLMWAVRAHLPDACLEMDPIQVSEELSRDDTYACSPLLYGYVSYARPGFRRHLLAFADMPAVGAQGPVGSTLGGTGIAVSARSSYLNVAADYAYWIADAACQRSLYAASGGQPASAAAWDDDKVNRQAGGFYRATRTTVERAWLRPRHAGYMAFQQAGGALVHRHLRGELSADQTLARLDDAYRASLAAPSRTADDTGLHGIVL